MQMMREWLGRLGQAIDRAIPWVHWVFEWIAKISWAITILAFIAGTLAALIAGGVVWLAAWLFGIAGLAFKISLAAACILAFWFVFVQVASVGALLDRAQNLYGWAGFIARLVQRILDRSKANNQNQS